MHQKIEFSDILTLLGLGGTGAGAYLLYGAGACLLVSGVLLLALGQLPPPDNRRKPGGK